MSPIGQPNGGPTPEERAKAIWWPTGATEAEMAHAIREAVIEEREACAKVCDEAARAFKDRQIGTVGLHRTLNEEREVLALQLEQAIRSRGKP